MEHVTDGFAVNNKSHAFQKRQACDRKGGQIERRCQSPLLIREKWVGKVQPLDGLAFPCDTPGAPCREGFRT